MYLKYDIIKVIESDTPLNNADHVGSFDFKGETMDEILGHIQSQAVKLFRAIYKDPLTVQIDICQRVLIDKRCSFD